MRFYLHAATVWPEAIAVGAWVMAWILDGGTMTTSVGSDNTTPLLRSLRGTAGTLGRVRLR